MSHEKIYQQLRSHLAYLKLSAASEALAPALEDAQTQKPSYTAFLEALLSLEVAADERRRMAGRLRFAHFPVEKRLESFDYDAQPSLDRRLIEELSTLRFISERANCLLVGPPGVGKSHIALALGYKAVEAGYRVYYTSASDLAARCHKAAIEGRWANTMRFFAGPQLLIVDELGYLPLQAEAASAIFQVVSRRYDHGSMIVTTNRSIPTWGEIFSDSMMAAAILDRFLHRATVVGITGDSYRMRAHRERLAQLTEGVVAAAES